jgi:hypothetical protein
MSEQKHQLTTRAANALSIQNLDDLQRMARIFVASGLFDADQTGTSEKKFSQACVKIQAGLEMGMQPFQAMNDLYIVKGKITMSYQSLGAKVRNTPGYDYKVLTWNDEIAEIDFLRNGQSIGLSSFGTEDMKKAGLGGVSWQKYKRNMLFARAMSNGVNTFCPEVCRGGSVYTPADFDIAEEAIEKEPESESFKETETGSEDSITNIETGEVYDPNTEASADEIKDLIQFAKNYGWAQARLKVYCKSLSEDGKLTIGQVAEIKATIIESQLAEENKFKMSEEEIDAIFENKSDKLNDDAASFQSFAGCNPLKYEA